MRAMTSAADVRAAARRGAWHGATIGSHCPASQQANLVILPQEAAVEFAAFCTRNPTPCPLIEIAPQGNAGPARAARARDLSDDLPGYRIYRQGALAEQRGDIRDLWQDDLVAFLLGAPIHVGDPEAIGITDLGQPDYGEPVPIDAQEVPVFWGCGVTPQAVAEKARVDLMITHESAQMFLTDLPREGGHRS